MKKSRLGQECACREVWPISKPSNKQKNAGAADLIGQQRRPGRKMRDFLAKSAKSAQNRIVTYAPVSCRQLMRYAAQEPAR
ncbi:hypothetical protein [Mesorhizobium opportunistum]|uniref:hypothetical protein n=1 Tax=Mesorhizobium opportunistum TaxID=593909 RepID=UPI001427BAF0|nr:hypothetical protein [Mesorhizobium opportunistum]